MFIKGPQSKKSVGQTGLSLTLDSLAGSEREKTDLHETGQASTASVTQGNNRNYENCREKHKGSCSFLLQSGATPRWKRAILSPTPPTSLSASTVTNFCPLPRSSSSLPLPLNQIGVHLERITTTNSLLTLGPGVTPPGENSVLLQANSLGQRNECLMLDMLMAYGPA